MSSTFGNVLHLSIFGQSHSPAIGCSLDGIPAGIAIDQECLLTKGYALACGFIVGLVYLGLFLARIDTDTLGLHASPLGSLGLGPG